MDQENQHNSRERLLAEFAPSSYADWRRLVERELGDAVFEQALVQRSVEGFERQPIYTAADLAMVPYLDRLPGQSPYLRGNRAHNSWAICQAITDAEPHQFNHTARHDLAYGLTMLEITLDAASRIGRDADHAEAADVGRGGLSLIHLADLEIALDDIDLAHVPLRMPTNEICLPPAALLIALARRRGHTAALHGSIGFDPLATLAVAGMLQAGLTASYDALAALTSWAHQNAPRLATVIVDTGVYHEAGADTADELACGLAAAVAHVRALMARGLPFASIAPHMEWQVALDTQIFSEIARLRAARLLWAKVAAAFDGTAATQRLRIHARSGRRNKSRRDPYVNMLRATLEAFAAVIGGCDSLTVAAFDEVAREPQDLGRRVARNTQIILARESHLADVADAGGGAYAIETLSDTLARTAWQRFQAIEAAGGLQRALEAGLVQQRIAATAASRAADLQQGRSVRVGVNRFADPQHEPLAAAPVDLQLTGASCP
ncbi:MAG TPA: acyl-CoA mutase large subunit family protein [Roseiflexaceae bacterium]|nr:acyl-CoA mutase large subunit family protein [Roseiflexaceae bacterium]